MEGISTNEIFEQKLVKLKIFWEWLSKQEYQINSQSFGSDNGYKIYRMEKDMMPFEIIEEDLRKHIPVPLVQMFGASGIRASFDNIDGIRIWFTNALDESPDFQEAKKDMQSRWDEIKNS